VEGGSGGARAAPELREAVDVGGAATGGLKNNASRVNMCVTTRAGKTAKIYSTR